MSSGQLGVGQPGAFQLGVVAVGGSSPVVPPFSPISVFTPELESVSSIGVIIGRQDVEQAYLNTIKTWLETYLAEVERQKNVELPRPPSKSTDSFFGGIDTMSFVEDMLPSIIVTAEPVEDAIHLASAGWYQWYEVGVHALVDAESEDDARILADHYAAALTTLIAQNEDLNGFAVRTMLITPGQADLEEREEADVTRRFAMTNSIFRSLVGSLVDEAAAPTLPTDNPPAVPTVGSTNLELIPIPDTELLSD